MTKTANYAKISDKYTNNAYTEDKKMKNTALSEYVKTALLTAIIFLLTFVPNIGYIPINPVINVTIIHVPVIIGSIVLGSRKGAFLGFAFGLSSFIKNTFFSTSAMSFVFNPLFHISTGYYLGALYALVICFVPRILVGVVPYCVYGALKKKITEVGALLTAGVAGSMTNTILVMGLIGILFKNEYTQMLGEKAANGVFAFIGATILTNGIAEAVVAAILSATVAKALLIMKKRA